MVDKLEMVNIHFNFNPIEISHSGRYDRQCRFTRPDDRSSDATPTFPSVLVLAPIRRSGTAAAFRTTLDLV